MSLAGVGVDMLEIARMQRVMERRPHFLGRVFTDDERAYCERTARPAEHYAARFAAREAVLKAATCHHGIRIGATFTIGEYLLPFFLRPGAERKAFDDFRSSMGIKCTGPGQEARGLSGGNQQKVLLAKCLSARP